MHVKMDNEQNVKSTVVKEYAEGSERNKIEKIWNRKDKEQEIYIIIRIWNRKNMEYSSVQHCT